MNYQASNPESLSKTPLRLSETKTRSGSTAAAAKKRAGRVSSRIFCLGGKNSLESLTTPTFVGTLYWHVINLFCTTSGY